MRTKELKLIVTFHTTTTAIAFETVCRQSNISGRLIPVPREISAGCGLSWASPVSEREAIHQLIKLKELQTAGMYELQI